MNMDENDNKEMVTIVRDKRFPEFWEKVVTSYLGKKQKYYFVDVQGLERPHYLGQAGRIIRKQAIANAHEVIARVAQGYSVDCRTCFNPRLSVLPPDHFLLKNNPKKKSHDDGPDVLVVLGIGGAEQGHSVPI